MRFSPLARACTAALIAGAFLVIAPAALAASAVDQYTEGIPTAKGQKSTGGSVHDGGTPNGGGTTGAVAPIGPQTSAELGKTKSGTAAAKAARLTAPSLAGPQSPTAPDSSDTGGGMGLLLPLILAATLATAVAIVVGRRRVGPTQG
jgi:hypothetical protein